MDKDTVILSALCAVLLSIPTSTSAENYEPNDYVGCYEDLSLRDLPVWGGRVSSIHSCIEICGKLKFPFAGLQDYVECWCGTNYGFYGKSSSCFLPCENGGICGGYWANSIYRTSAKKVKPKAAEVVQPKAAKNLKPKAAKNVKPKSVKSVKTKVAETVQPKSTAKSVPTKAAKFVQSKAAEPVQPKTTKFVQPKDYIGCFKGSSWRKEMSTFGGRVSSIHSCIEKCRQKKFRFAGLKYGDQCWCTNKYGRYEKSSECTLPCAKDGVCGGFEAYSIYRT